MNTENPKIQVDTLKYKVPVEMVGDARYYISFVCFTYQLYYFITYISSNCIF